MSVGVTTHKSPVIGRAGSAKRHQGEHSPGPIILNFQYVIFEEIAKLYIRLLKLEYTKAAKSSDRQYFLYRQWQKWPTKTDKIRVN